MDLRFFVIYTPQTFHLLKLAVQSMHWHSSYRFTLVGNGIDGDEVAAMQAFCEHDERYDFVDLPGNVTVPHGTALMHLLRTFDEPYFCFMDSDIFADGPYMDELEACVQAADVFSSCRPLEWLHKPSAPGFRGHNTQSPSGLGLATTYFAIYQRPTLLQTLDQHRISLERYMRRDQVPTPVAQALHAKDQHTWKFNTGKLANVIQAAQGVRFNHQELAHVFHLGGVSRYSEHSINDTRKQISPNNHQAMDRLAVRVYFHDLLAHLSGAHNPPPAALELHDTVFQTVVKQHGDKLRYISQQLAAVN